MTMDVTIIAVLTALIMITFIGHLVNLRVVIAVCQVGNLKLIMTPRVLQW